MQIAKQGADARLVKNWDWVSTSVWTENMLAALENGVKGGKWFSLIDKLYATGVLEKAFKQVKSNKGAAGVDGVSIQRFEAQKEKYVRELRESLKAGTYRPESIRRAYIPKANGDKRPLGIPAVRDRVAQTALKMVVEPIFENAFLPMSYGFRPGRGCKDALREVDGHLRKGFAWVVDADLKSYFDTIPHDKLMQRVADYISDGRVLTLVESFLRQEILDDLNRWIPLAGTPQGAVLSPMLANLYLHLMDDLIIGSGHKMVRYADDFVILCRSQAEAEEALMKVREWTSRNGLTLHPDKTHIGDCRVKGQGFEFLGYRFESGRRWALKKSLKNLRDKIRGKTRRARGVSLSQVIAEVNPIFKGWFEYFRHAYKTTFPNIDGFIRRRLRAFLRKQEKRPGFGNRYSDHKKWPNSFFVEHGMFTMTAARVKRLWLEKRVRLKPVQLFLPGFAPV